MKNILVLFSVYFLSSCSTLIYTPKEHVRISTNQSGINITLNGKEVANSADNSYELTLPKKYRNAELKISKPGFEPQTFNFTRVPREGIRGINIAGTIIGAGLLITGAALTQNPIPEEKAKAVPCLIAGGAVMLPSLIDIFTKSSNTFVYKNLDFDLVPSIPDLRGNNKKPILCNSVNIKVLPGTSVGSRYFNRSGAFHKIDDYSWNETSNISVEELTVQANNEFYAIGYKVPGLSDKFGESNGHAKFSLKSEIKDLEVDTYSKYQTYMARTDTRIKATVIWSVYDNARKKVVLEKEFSTLVWGNDKTLKILMLNLVSASVKKLVADKDFDSIFEEKETLEQPKDKAVETADKITLKQPAHPEKISELVESSVTVDLGDGHGSGVIISEDGYILTNAHVTIGEKKVSVILSSGLSLTADVLKEDEAADIALLKLQGKGFKPVYISLEEAMAGEDVIAIGTPNSIQLGQSISKGIISGKRDIDGKIYIQTDVSISPGNSGGPLFNSKKELIAIITSKLVGHGIEGVGFTIPIKFALDRMGIEIK